MINCIIFDIYISRKYDNIVINSLFCVKEKFKIDKTIYITL